MTGQRRLGIFGGTFDPIHLGHLIVAEAFRYELRLDRVLFLPSNQPPHKEGQVISPIEDRIAMVRLAIADNPGFALSLVDAEQRGPTYTADTLQRLAELHPGAELAFLIGLDSLRDLPTWHDPERIVRQARLGVAARPAVALNLEAVLRAVPAARGRLDFIEAPLLGISGSDLRRRVRAGAPIRYRVPDGVAVYIDAHGLYREPARASGAEPAGGLPERR